MGKSVNKTLKWTSSNTKYATVSKSGKVKGKQAGKGKKVTIAPIARYEMVEKTVSDDSVSSNTIE